MHNRNSRWTFIIYGYTVQEKRATRDEGKERLREAQFDERAGIGRKRTGKGKWTESGGEEEREQFNAVIKFLIAPWEMCFGIAPGQLSIAPRLFSPQSMLWHTHTHTHYLNKQEFSTSRLSESQNMCQLHQMMHRQEETQRRSRLARRSHHLQSLARRSH